MMDSLLVCAAAEVDVPVVGGHAGITILPLFSQVLVLKGNLGYAVLNIKSVTCMVLRWFRSAVVYD